ncbi:MAG: glycosyltransferase family 8 protein [Treponema sp.]|nr:glycosyltransferase family 8 protein [Treponema sp.]
MFNKKPTEIPIFFAADENYAPYLCVAMKSMLANASKDYFYKIHVLTSFISDKYKNIMLKEVPEYASLEFISIEQDIKEIKSKLHLRDYYSFETYYRFFIADLFPQYDKVIYLDSDIIVLGDISDLYFTNISNFLVGAVQEQVMAHYECFGNYVTKALNVPYKKYFNAGILLMNTKMFRAFDVLGHFVKLLTRFKFRVTQDEDYLNVICKGKVKWLNLGWNKMPFEEIGFDDVDLQLIHYTLGWKPWHYENVRYDEYFWQYAAQLEIYDELKKQLIEYSTNPENKVKEQEGFERLCQMALDDINDKNNYKNTTEREMRKHYLARGIRTIASIPGIKSLSRFINFQTCKLMYNYSEYKKRISK